jgi:hypothetical protein
VHKHAFREEVRAKAAARGVFPFVPRKELTATVMVSSYWPVKNFSGMLDAVVIECLIGWISVVISVYYCCGDFSL